MKFPSYAEVIKLGKEAVESLKAPLRAKEMKKQAELEMLKLESKGLELEQKIQELSSEYPINFEALITAANEKALLERKMDQYKKIITEMFPES